jgi:hypothetical protein
MYVAADKKNKDEIQGSFTGPAAGPSFRMTAFKRNGIGYIHLGFAPVADC